VQPDGELADGGELLARGKLAGGDHVLDAVGYLEVDGGSTSPVYLDVQVPVLPVYELA